MDLSSKYIGSGVIIIVAVLLICLLGVMNLIHPAEIYSLPILSVSTIIITIGVLALTGIAYTFMGSRNFTQAFALPDGTIRAVIAMSFIVLFAIMSFYAFSKLTVSDVTSIEGVDQSQIDDIKKSLGQNFIISVPSAPPSKTVRVFYFQPVNPNGIDFTKQMFILLGTLVTSISSFYFGAASAKAADNNPSGQQSANVPISRPKSVSPNVYAAAAMPAKFKFTLSGDNMDATKEVKLTYSNTSIVAEHKVTSSSVLDCTAAIEPIQPKGYWNVVLTDKSGRTSGIDHAVNVT